MENNLSSKIKNFFTWERECLKMRDLATSSVSISVNTLKATEQLFWSLINWLDRRQEKEPLVFFFTSLFYFFFKIKKLHVYCVGIVSQYWVPKSLSSLTELQKCVECSPWFRFYLGRTDVSLGKTNLFFETCYGKKRFILRRWDLILHWSRVAKEERYAWVEAWFSSNFRI